MLKVDAIKSVKMFSVCLLFSARRLLLRMVIVFCCCLRLCLVLLSRQGKNFSDNFRWYFEKLKQYHNTQWRQRQRIWSILCAYNIHNETNKFPISNTRWNKRKLCIWWHYVLVFCWTVSARACVVYIHNGRNSGKEVELRQNSKSHSKHSWWLLLSDNINKQTNEWTNERSECGGMTMTTNIRSRECGTRGMSFRNSYHKI